MNLKKLIKKFNNVLNPKDSKTLIKFAETNNIKSLNKQL